MDFNVPESPVFIQAGAASKITAVDGNNTQGYWDRRKPLAGGFQWLACYWEPQPAKKSATGLHPLSQQLAVLLHHPDASLLVHPALVQLAGQLFPVAARERTKKQNKR